MQCAQTAKKFEIIFSKFVLGDSVEIMRNSGCVVTLCNTLCNLLASSDEFWKVSCRRAPPLGHVCNNI